MAHERQKQSVVVFFPQLTRGYRQKKTGPSTAYSRLSTVYTKESVKSVVLWFNSLLHTDLFPLTTQDTVFLFKKKDFKLHDKHL